MFVPGNKFFTKKKKLGNGTMFRAIFAVVPQKIKAIDAFNK
jgi:hypothetical protein